MKKHIIVILLLPILLVQCTKVVDYSNPYAFDASNYFTTPEKIKEALTATYSAYYFRGLVTWKWFTILDAMGNE